MSNIKKCIIVNCSKKHSFTIEPPILDSKVIATIAPCPIPDCKGHVTWTRHLAVEEVVD